MFISNGVSFYLLTCMVRLVMGSASSFFLSGTTSMLVTVFHDERDAAYSKFVLVYFLGGVAGFAVPAVIGELVDLNGMFIIYAVSCLVWCYLARTRIPDTYNNLAEIIKIDGRDSVAGDLTETVEYRDFFMNKTSFVAITFLFLAMFLEEFHTSFDSP
mmetsp:Transcript_11879/g.8280  ORF Transcript_11879/g.8280 Transcript_11879/m.8280 type:complete len:158 (-) Transcript_11879:639-1112(-)